MMPVSCFDIVWSSCS